MHGGIHMDTTIAITSKHSTSLTIFYSFFFARAFMTRSLVRP
jgi:hypothetical protein